MEFATGALGTLLPKLGQLLQCEYNLQKGTEKNIEFLKRELECIQAALRNVGEVPREELNELVKIWARDARELSYDMEDIVDIFLVRVQGPDPPSKKSSKRFIKKMRNIVTMAKTRHEIGKDIRDIKERVKEVAERCDRLTQQRIVSVFGFGGLGKTTLTKAVYDKLKGQFNRTAFVPVGRNPDLKKVFKDILIDLHKQGYMNFNLEILDERQLIDKLQEFLENKRYFIVIDDVWDTLSWGTIKLALVENDSGSRIIITTRTHEVPEKLMGKLFLARIFGGESKSSDHQPKDEVFDKILRKCDGIPLAVITMASLLVGKPKEEWSEVHRSIGFGNKQKRQVENTMKILSFSYYDVPCHLRACLLHLSVVPEDYLIGKRPLIWMWIAEGFVHEKKRMSLFEIGAAYFNQLVNRSMIQLVEEVEGDAMECACQVHDMVLDLIHSISSEENFVTILDRNKEFGGRARRLVLQNNNNRIVEAHMDMQQLRSFISFECDIDKQGVPLSSFKFVRALVLEIHTSRGKMKRLHLKHLRNLIHLRCLRLLGSDFDLPEEVGTLKFLQTLEVEGMPMRKMDTFSVGLLTQLFCLRFRYPPVRTAPNGIGKLMSLVDLEIYCDLRHEEDPLLRRFVKGLGSLRNLMVLRTGMASTLPSEVRVVQVDMVETPRNLEKMEHLSLKTVGTPPSDTAAWEAAGFLLPARLRRLILTWIRFSRFPSSCINPSRLPNLSHLSLRVQDGIDEQDLRILGGLPELRFLELYVYSTTTEVVCNNPTTTSDAAGDDHFFQKLRRCSLWYSELRLLLTSKDDADSGTSFRMQNVRASMLLLGSERKKGGLAPTLLSIVHELSFQVRVREFKDGVDDDCSSLGSEYFASLQDVSVDIDCRDASAVEVEELEAALRHAAHIHPNRPTLTMTRWLPELRFIYLGVYSIAQVECNPPTSDATFHGHLFQKLRCCRLWYSQIRLLPSKDAVFLMQDVSASMLLGSERKGSVGVGLAHTLLPSIQNLCFEACVRGIKDGNNHGSLGSRLRWCLYCGGGGGAAAPSQPSHT
ncbi:putative disease resistance RPP13-like protein 3 isoform X1 [Panicum miliaceum]|uniref:Disease resistance RPP13-like protein 3 isoform X1 n=1 Tax=Panicum miliaceum TaxID=4540 RepID=A0A3L6Q3G6_PANMI|nr:putative disease resistance RPP13-like protein 3 isoform X1 [Panicum miliaceum]